MSTAPRPWRSRARSQSGGAPVHRGGAQPLRWRRRWILARWEVTLETGGGRVPAPRWQPGCADRVRAQAAGARAARRRRCWKGPHWCARSRNAPAMPALIDHERGLSASTYPEAERRFFSTYCTIGRLASAVRGGTPERPGDRGPFSRRAACPPAGSSRGCRRPRGHGPDPASLRLLRPLMGSEQPPLAVAALIPVALSDPGARPDPCARAAPLCPCPGSLAARGSRPRQVPY